MSHNFILFWTSWRRALLLCHTFEAIFCCSGKAIVIESLPVIVFLIFHPVFVFLVPYFRDASLAHSRRDLVKTGLKMGFEAHHRVITPCGTILFCDGPARFNRLKLRVVRWRTHNGVACRFGDEIEQELRFRAKLPALLLEFGFEPIVTVFRRVMCLKPLLQQGFPSLRCREGLLGQFLMIWSLVHDKQRMGGNMREELLRKPLGEVLAVHLAMGIPGVFLGLKHQLGVWDPSICGHGVHNDEARAFARGFVHPWSIRSKIPGVVCRVVDVERRFIQIHLRPVGATIRSAVAACPSEVLASGDDDLIAFFHSAPSFGSTMDKSHALQRTPEGLDGNRNLPPLLMEPAA